MILVVGAGGSGQSYFMEFLINNTLSINDCLNKDKLKHMPSPLNIPTNTNIEKCIFIYNHPYYCLLSHYRRKWMTFQCRKLGNPYKLLNKQINDYDLFKKLTLENNKDIYGIEYQFNNWITQKTSFPILFLNFNDVLHKKDVIDEFLGVKLDYTNFKIEERHTYDKDELYPIYEQLFNSMETRIKTYRYMPLSSINKCKREGCNFKIHTNPSNNGGTHCCMFCKAGKADKLHGPSCQYKLTEVYISADAERIGAAFAASPKKSHIVHCISQLKRFGPCIRTQPMRAYQFFYNLGRLQELLGETTFLTLWWSPIEKLVSDQNYDELLVHIDTLKTFLGADYDEELIREGC